MTLKNIKHWVFDMDGTLTVAVHDFKLIHRELCIADDEDILTHLAGLPPAESAEKHAWLLEHERELALASTPAPGAVELSTMLASRYTGPLTFATPALTDDFAPVERYTLVLLRQ